MKRFTFYCAVFSFLFLFVAVKTFASEYFSTSYAVTYDVEESGNTKGTIDVTLTNKTSDYYASSYKVQAGFKDLTNVKAKDPGGELTPKVTSTPDGTVIEAEFNEKAVGKDSSLTYTITFDTKDVAKKHGSIWEINIPGISDPNAFDKFTVDVNVPESFGEPIYIKPDLKKLETTFSKEDLKTSGISIAYGTSQDYNLDLTYHLENNNLFPIKTEIALPPTTNYQEVYIDDINPRPDNVVTDSDGNWLAKYSLDSGEKLDIHVKATVLVSLIPKKESMDKSQLEEYLKPDKYWEVDDPKIQELAKKLETPRAIYNYVTTVLNYDFSRVENDEPRLGGIKALANPDSAVCLEFTDLFISLARAAGIPAREVDGYGHTENERQRPLSLEQDILHAWPEYYDREKQTWIMVDPTWGKTTGGVDYFDTLDFDHITFVIKGKDSEYPVPAGGYKTPSNIKSRDISVSFDPGFSKPLPALSYTVDSKDEYLAGFPAKAKLVITNSSGTITPETKVEVVSKDFSPNKRSIVVESIPPFGKNEIPIEFDKTPLLTNKEMNFKILVAGQTKEVKTKVVPIFLSDYALIFGGILIGVFTIIIFIIAGRSRRISV